jgi:hypothetical protein
MLDTGPVPRSKQSLATQRLLALAVAGAAAVVLLAALFTNKVLVDQASEITVSCGLKQCVACVDQCHSTSIFDLVADIERGGGKASSVWPWAGAIGWWSGLVAVVGLLIAVGMVASRKYVRLPISPTTIALLGGGLGLITGCLFIATKPDGVGVTRVGWTFWAFGLGVVGAIVSAFLLSRQLALLEPEFDPGESPPAPADEPWQDV